MKKQTMQIITAAIIIITVVFVCFWMWGILPNGITSIGKPFVNSTPEIKDDKSNEKKLPPELPHEIRKFTSKYALAVDKWEFDIVKNEITLYVYDIQSEDSLDALQGTAIGNSTVRIIHDLEFEKSRSEVSAYLTQLQKTPEYQIAGISMITDPFVDPIGHYVELWVRQSTPENQKLDNTMIQGWKILVYPVAPLPTETGNSSGNNT